MTSRENLVPTAIVDKNGRQTTVHKKAANTRTGTSLPRVGGSSVSEAKRRNGLVDSVLSAWPYYDVSSAKGHNMLMVLRQCSMDSLERLESMRLENPQVLTMLGFLATDDDSEESLREAMYFYPHMGNLTFYFARNIMASLHEYRQLPDSRDFSAESDEVRTQCKALISVTNGLINLTQSDLSSSAFRPSQHHFVIDDDALVGFVLDHTDSADLIAGFLQERGVTDVEVLSQLLASESPALGTGLL